MNNQFDIEINNVQKELLDLKTSAEYSSARSNSTIPSLDVSTGLYRIVYDSHDEEIISSFYPATDDWYCYVYGRTPSQNSQVIEVLTTYWDNDTQQYVTDTCPITIVSNFPVNSITRIS